MPPSDYFAIHAAPSVLVASAKPDYIYLSLGIDADRVKRHRTLLTPNDRAEGVKADGKPDSLIIQKTFEEIDRPVLMKVIEHTSKSALASALAEGWDIVHIECVVGADGQIFLEDGQIPPHILKQWLANTGVRLLVLMDCHTRKVVLTSATLGVRALIAAKDMLPPSVAEKFCYTLYREIAGGEIVGQAFYDARAVGNAELVDNWDPNPFFFDGDPFITF